MNDDEVISYLNKKAPVISWTIVVEQDEKKIEGSMILNGEKIWARLPITYNQDMLDDIVQGFIMDYARKITGDPNISLREEELIEIGKGKKKLQKQLSNA